MSNEKRRLLASLAGATLAMGALLAAGGPAAAGGTGEVEREGDCSGNADWRLEVEREDGGLQVDLRIRQDDQAGKVWDIRIRQDGVRFFKALRTTNEDGEIRIRRQRPDTRGPDTFSFKAFGPGSQTCRGSVTI
jgi:hypothetical protein